MERMTERRTSQPASRTRKTASKQQQGWISSQVSAIVGGALIALALFWFAWLLIRQLNPVMNAITFPLPGSFAQKPATLPSNPLATAGITLTSPAQGQEPALTKQQALLLAGQIEPAVAAHAGEVDAQYTLFSYSNTTTAQAGFHDIPVWLVHYSKIAEPHPDSSADPQASAASHDFYVFLAANSGKELLAIWL